MLTDTRIRVYAAAWILFQTALLAEVVRNLFIQA